MKLTDYEKELLNGDHGEAVQMAMRVLYDLGEYYGADDFVEITACHDDSTVYFGEAQVAFAEYLAAMGAKFAVPTSTNACALDMERWDIQKHEASWMAATRRIEASHLKMGAVPSWTCAPYQTGFSPVFGSQVAFAESNVISFMNSIVGARTNRYAGPLELLCGIAGRAPNFGLHKTENRYAQGLVILGDDIKEEMFDDPSMFNYVAYAYGKIVGNRVWALQGMPKRNLTMDNLKQFSATVASSGGIALFHLIGITPEAQTLEMAFGGKEPKEVVIIGLKELKEAESQLCNYDETGTIDLVSLGCPHFSCAEFQDLEDKLAGRRIHPDTAMWIFTSRANYANVESSGLLARIQRLGVQVFVDGCLMEYPTKRWGTRSIMTNSGKFGTYCFNKVGIHPVFGNLQDCVETAVQGKVVRGGAAWDR
ncbi:aconitase X [Anaerotruncus rubiinfantis]|uniref:aconitase X n=1 Tax=Anaerotruncus rubiinfantis TaxID=1720200 RepID=UPI000830D632|nr:aconitase X catalytic domain-containing protein [Anaerotruncus rubiinfantis]